MELFERILGKALDVNPGLDVARFRKAFEYAKKANEGRHRVSGETYIEHDLSVIDILLSFNPDEDTLIAALLHDCAGGKEVHCENIRREFGEDVEFLVNAVDDLKGIKFTGHNIDQESLRQMFLTMAKDLRAIIVRVVDRLDNLMKVEHYPREEQKLLGRESLEVYAPICSRLGIYSLKTMVEDYSFRCLYPEHYEQVNSDLEEYLAKGKVTLDDIQAELVAFLDKNGIEARVEGRVKNLYSIYRKLKVKNLSSLSDLHDIFAMRIILPDKKTNDHLYGVLGLIHSNWKPLRHRFKDYIAVPKPNGYRSLHTAVVGMSSNALQSTEIQIRTETMHKESEFGVASHWIYDAAKKNNGTLGIEMNDSEKFENYNKWIRALAEMQEEMKNGRDIIDILQTEVFNDRIFVMTPKGEVKELPKGATPIDFAYSIHSDIGHRCNLAKVNGAVVPLDYHLKNGEVVEVVAGNKPHPKLAWLSIVKTPVARNKIRAFFNEMEKDKSFKVGREIINKYLLQMGRQPLDDSLSLFKDYSGKRLTVKERMSLIEEVGNGSVLALPVLKNIFGGSIINRDRKKGVVKTDISRNEVKSDDVIVAGERDLPYRLANCCKPKTGLPIVGYVGKNRCVTIHLEKCRVLREANEQRIVSAIWAQADLKYEVSVKLEILTGFRVGIIRDICSVIVENDGNILFFNDIGKQGEIFRREIQLETINETKLTGIIESIRGVRNVLGVKRV